MQKLGAYLARSAGGYVARKVVQSRFLRSAFIRQVSVSYSHCIYVAKRVQFCDLRSNLCAPFSAGMHAASNAHSRRPLYRLALIDGKGVGMIASRPIKRGQLILAESPLFTCPIWAGADLIEEKLSRLSADQRYLFEHLSNAHSGKMHALAGILKTNALPLGVEVEDVGVFLLGCRFKCVAPLG